MFRIREVLAHEVVAPVRRDLPGRKRGVDRVLGGLESGGHDPTVRLRYEPLKRPRSVVL